MKKIFCFLLISFFTTALLAQKLTNRITFLIVIDNEFPGSDIINSEFLIKDSANNIKEKINFNYEVGKLIMPQLDYEKLFNIKRGSKLIVKFTRRNLDLNADYEYEEIIDSKLINNKYLILRIYNAYNNESKAKYYFKKDQSYVCQLLIPGFRTILTTLKK